MCHVGHGSHGSRVKWVMNHVGNGSVTGHGSWITWVTGYVGHRSRGSWVSCSSHCQLWGILPPLSRSALSLVPWPFSSTSRTRAEAGTISSGRGTVAIRWRLNGPTRLLPCVVSALPCLAFAYWSVSTSSQNTADRSSIPDDGETRWYPWHSLQMELIGIPCFLEVDGKITSGHRTIAVIRKYLKQRELVLIYPQDIKTKNKINRPCPWGHKACVLSSVLAVSVKCHQRVITSKVYCNTYSYQVTSNQSPYK